MTGIISATVAAISTKSGGSIGVAAGLPAGQNLVEGTEANLMVGAAAANSSWRKAAVATGAALVSLIPLLGGIWFLYKAGGAYADYAVGAIVVGIGIHEVLEGLKDRPKGGDRPRPHALDGPLGIDPADPNRISRFQAQHGLTRDGVLGPRTRGAILGELRRRGEEARPNRLGVDVTDEASVTAFQRRVGLRPDGVIGPRTQGALAAESARPVPDPADPAAVRRFQCHHRLAETGIVDEATQGALHALGSEGLDGFGAPTHDGLVGADSPNGVGRADGAVSFVDHIDLTNGEEITRFQRERGLPATGSVDAPTQGALRAEIEWHSRLPAFDPADPAAVRRFQSTHRLAETGVVDEGTQAVLVAERESVGEPAASRWRQLGADPTDPVAIRRFQALHGLKRSGEIDEQTRLELRRAEAWMAGVDPADPAAVARFQREQGIDATGEVDGETQGAMRRYRHELQQRHELEPPDGTPAWYPLDPTDPGSVKRFQRHNDLAESGTIDSATQTALRSAVADRMNGAVEAASDQNGLIARYRDAWPGYFGFLLEGGEAGLFTIGIAQGTGNYMVAAIAGGAAFAVPWLGLIWLRDWLQSRPKWMFELTIGTVLVSAGTIFGLFRATGIFG